MHINNISKQENSEYYFLKQVHLNIIKRVVPLSAQMLFAMLQSPRCINSITAAIGASLQSSVLRTIQ